MNASETWIPPPNPDPSKILHEGVDDTREAKYSVALSKFVWFHENSLAYEPHLSAVRLSFALGYWYDLAEIFPPALDAMRLARDRAEKAFEQSQYAFEHFHELASMNRVLGEGTRTANIFKRLCEIDLEVAQRVYHVAERFLIEAGDYYACRPFLDHQRRCAFASDSYQLNQQFEESRLEHPIPVPKFARRHFTENTATLVALLVLNDRLADAKSACATALETLDDPQFREVLDAALTGHLPSRQFG